jgi:hypothetical protein
MTQQANHQLDGQPGLARGGSSRRGLLAAGGAGALGALLAACGGGGDSSTGTTPQAVARRPSDLEIVNFALTLEYLEADFYDKVLASGLVRGEALEAVRIIGAHEREHVQRLRGVAANLGEPVARPRTTFPLENQRQILNLARTFENLGAAAYIGQAPSIRDPELLSQATSIATVEARHAAEVNRLVGRTPTPDGSFERPLTMQQVMAQARPYLGSTAAS